MKTIYLRTTALALLFATLLTGATASRAAEWMSFVSGPGRFKVTTPGAPHEEALVARTGAGPLTTHLFVVQGEPVTYVVSYCDLPAATETMEPGKVLDHARDGAVASRNGRLLAERHVALNYCPGRDLDISLSGNRMVRTRIFLAKRRLYQVVAVQTGGKLAEADMERYFDSFEMTRM